MELKGNMYVRVYNTLEDYIEITKVKKILDEDHFLDTREYQYGIFDIKKSSFNIDLIELGDLIEVECEKGNTNIFEVIAIDDKNKELGIFNNNFEIDWVGIEQVKSILTREMFESKKYEVE